MTIAELMCAAYVALAFPNADTACENMEHVVRVAEKYDVEPTVMVSLIFVESRWTTRAVSRDGACGLTQVLPRYTSGYRNRFGKRLTCRGLFNPKASIHKGIQILSYHLKRYRGNYKRSLCAYNAGGSRCKRTSAQNKGHRYARKVLRTSRKIEREMRAIESEGYADPDVPGCYE